MENNSTLTKSKKNFLGIAIILLIGMLIGYSLMTQLSGNPFIEKNIEDKRTEFILERDAIVGELIIQGKYACCLEKPCAYCIEKTPKHGEGATCNCLEDVVTGVHPCGECIGEIMEGHGNPFLAEYFAKSIAEEVGEQHINSIKQIISEKYEISIEEQL